MTLEEVNKTAEFKLPFEIISDASPFKVLDCLFSNYEIPQTESDICSYTQVSNHQVNVILDNLLEEKIIKKEKDVETDVFLANFSSPKTMGLFSYYRAVLDENLEKLAYNKVDLK